MKMKKIAIAMGVATLIAGSAAQAEFSANVAITSDYMFRGVSQNDNDMAIQGGFDYSHESGIYVGVWGSNVDDAVFNGSSMELDTYIGWSGDLGPVSLDVGALRYNYPGQATGPSADTNEYHVGVSKDFGVASASFTVNYSPDFFNLGSERYYDLGLEVPAGMVTIAAHYGKTSISEKTGITKQDYADWSLGVSTEYEGFGFDLTYSDTDDKGMCKGSGLCGGHLALTVSRSF
ncbi:TorF family putative porin [endosymbiont of unidentified scaly snail isolate Monju]|uniref:TorF family putative porin n=1 Tax=endosymbiont of unidentified scaly snail isolate Monju TaxID=1248727 RepID=UPI0003892A5E|nr:TorF family putative porin [endosymbiont of unidentified scaly snail isolate Monju]BAN69947.1 conserved hypothetical protein [endosymbiont of unidentified scaly snail isolate Monju]